MNTYNMKHIKLFESFIVEFNSPFSTGEVENANKFLTKETGFKNKEKTSRPALWPSISIGKFRGSEIVVTFTKITNDKPFDENNIKVDSINDAGASRLIKVFKLRNPEEDKLMKNWAKQWGFKITNSSENLETTKNILPKEVINMIEEYNHIIKQVYGEDFIEY